MYNNEKRLGFLSSILDVMEVGKGKLAEMLDVSPQSIFAAFKRDDMKLSKIEDILDKLGLKLSVRLEKEGDNMKDIVNGMENILGRKELKRLTFLRLAFRRYGIKKDDLAQKLDFNVAGIFRWFRVDDILISHLYEIAKFYDLKLILDVTRK